MFQQTSRYFTMTLFNQIGNAPHENQECHSAPYIYSTFNTYTHMQKIKNKQKTFSPLLSEMQIH